MIIILAAVLSYIKYTDRPLNPIALYLGIGFIIISLISTEIHRLTHSYEINKNSLILNSGLIYTNSKRIEFSAISDFEVIQNPWQRILIYGNIEVHMYSRESKVMLRNLNKPFFFIDFLEKNIEAHGGRKR